MLSDAALSCWAKYDEKAGDLSLSLAAHLTDSAAIAGHIWDDLLSAQEKRIITRGTTGDEASARPLALFLAGGHDIGKATPRFAAQVPLLTGRMSDAGLDFPRGAQRMAHDTQRISHSAMGMVIQKEWLKNQCGFGRKQADVLAVIAGSHHGVPPTKEELNRVTELPDTLGRSSRWNAVRTELLTHIAELTDAEGVLRSLAQAPPITPQAQMLLTGFVIVADWIASNVEYFPYEWEDAETRAARAWERLNLPHAWRMASTGLTIDELLPARFDLPADTKPRPVQHVVHDEARRAGGGLIIVEAPTGEGKTEAALLAVEELAAATGASGCFIALPTMSTGDAMLPRVLDWMRHVPSAEIAGEVQSTFLAHSKASLNDEYMALRSVRSVEPDADETTRAVVHHWLSGRKKGVLANVVVGTIDQVLFGALKTRHVMLRHLALANKVVVIDEVHAVDAYMSVYLERALQWLGSYGVAVVLLSATLPPSARVRLARAYAPVTEDDAEALASGTAYPVVSAVAPDGAVTARPVEASSRRSRIRIERLEDDDAALIEALGAAIDARGTAAVIRNTVGRAQHAADVAREAFPGMTVVLAHSRFLAVDRSQNEARLRSLLGPASGDAGQRVRGPLIVVGTQVLEQSLDIDVDLMISDVAPVDLLIQRIGRLHRHERVRPEGFDEPRLLLTGADWAADPPTFEPGTQAVYGRHLLLRTVDALDALPDASLHSPEDVSGLVRRVYDGSAVEHPGWSESAAEAEREWDALVARKEKDARDFLLPYGRALRGDILGLLAAMSDAGEDTAQGQAQVRDTEDSIEALVVQRLDDGLHLMPWMPVSDRVIPERRRPDDALARAIARSSVRVPPKLCRGWRIDRTIRVLEDNAFEGWQQSPLLAGSLVLVLDERLEAEVNGVRLAYSRENGLEEREEAA